MFWYDSWLVVLGLVISIALTLMVIVREDWRGVGPIVVAVMVLTFIACLPAVPNADGSRSGNRQRNHGGLRESCPRP